MAVLPDLRVTMNSLVIRGDRVEYHWTLEGRNSGPGGRGNRVRVSGFEEWKVGQDGLIAQSQGHSTRANTDARSITSRAPARHATPAETRGYRRIC